MLASPYSPALASCWSPRWPSRRRCGETKNASSSAARAAVVTRPRARAAPPTRSPDQAGPQDGLDPEAARQPLRGVRALRRRRGAEGARRLNRIQGSTDAGASSQIPIINSTVQQKPNAIIIAGNDPNAVAPALKQAAQRGIKVVGMDSDVAPDARSVFVNQVTTKLVGENQVESIAKQIGNKGQIAILSATANATNQNAWIKVMKDTLKQPKYKDMKLVKVAYGDDDDQKSFQQMQGLIQAYPNLKGVISPTTVGVAAAARYLSKSPEKGKVKLTGLGFPNQMRKFVDDGTVDEFQLWVPKDVGYLAGQAAAALVVGPDHRQAGREVHGRPPGQVHDRPERRDRARPADDVQQGQHRRLRLLGVAMTAADTTPPAAAEARPAPRARVGVFGIGLEAYWPPVRRACASASRATSAASRSASRASAREVVSAGLVDTAQGAREAGDRFARRAGRPRPLPRRHLRDVEPGAARRPGRRRRRSCCSGCSRRATLDYANTDTGEWLANCAACCVPEIAGAFTRARIPYDTVAGHDRRRRARLGEDRARGCAPPAWRARCAARASASSATPIRGCSTCTRTSRPCTRSSAPTSRCSRSTTSARASRPRRDEEVDAKQAEIRAMFDFADPSDDPIAGPIEPTSSSTGRRASPSASTGSPPTSTSTR